MGWLSDVPAVAAVACTDGVIPAQVFDSPEPMLLRGLVEGWPAVRECRRSVESARRYLGRFHTSAPLTVYVGDTSIDGRFFYNQGFTGFNFRSGKATLAQVLQRLAAPNREDATATIYVGSTPVDQWLPGFRQLNDVALPTDDALASFWLGSEARISAHYDFPNNVACAVAGERRLTLFPPEQIGNLYVGPIDRTPSGQAISLVDFARPDFARFPKFAEATQHARGALMGPGDAIFIPSMWWHHVESLASFNLLVNYWWCSSPAYMGAPSQALLHAILALRELPPRQRAAWRHVFDHYVFDAGETVYEHIPAPGRGCLAPLDQAAARRIRAELLNKLNQ